MTGIDIDTFERERPRLFGLAYRMTGSVADADDIVQEAWLRAGSADDIERPAAWLTTVVTRLTIDRLRSARRRREQYVGPWLPEPILTDRDPAHIVEADESLTLSFLHVLDRLEPVERAVFLLREVFDVDYDEVAGVVGRTPETCRQIAHRARQRVRSERPRFDIDPDRRQALLDSFLLAALSGEPHQLQKLLADDVVLVSDGGPSRHAARRPVIGPHRVSRFIVNLTARLSADAEVVHVHANGEPSVAVLTADQTLLLVPEFDGGLLRRIELVSAPEKLSAVCAVIGGRHPAA
jgi:RNA polymerase sigma-70 factor, ECF subfamily